MMPGAEPAYLRWAGFNLDSQWDPVNGVTFENWLRTNLDSKLTIGTDGAVEDYVYGVSLAALELEVPQNFRRIQLSYNLTLFANQFVLGIHEAFSQRDIPARTQEVIEVSWKKPDPGWLKLNVDGASKGDSR
ncbi:hypothetical protein O6P43_017342 [Quillaja saponaria]|uniref:Uncharacterized protein n=1 Tax=Quillaja saponaria TaxID=32244 RepID=A0AAD7PN95_QUISA|nr:hypothetical protein O6P43_017342 [Quillaja saponaria]